MVRRAAFLALALFVGFRLAPPEQTKRLFDVYTSCLEHPFVARTIERVSPYVSSATERVGPYVSSATERVGPYVSSAIEGVSLYVASATERVSPYVTSATEKFLQALTYISVDPQSSKQWVIAKTSEHLTVVQAFSSAMYADAKAQVLAMYSEAANSTLLADAKSYSFSMYSQILNSKLVADAKARTLTISSQILSWARGLSPMYRTILAVATIAMVVLMLAMTCRRRKVNASSDEIGVVVAEVATPDATETGLQIPQDPLRRRRSRSRCDSPRPQNGNDENAAPPTNRSVGSEAFLAQVNSATTEELLSLPGLGEKSVSKIIKYRSKHGSINDVDELVGKVGLARVVVSKMAKVHGL